MQIVCVFNSVYMLTNVVMVVVLTLQKQILKTNILGAFHWRFQGGATAPPPNGRIPMIFHALRSLIKWIILQPSTLSMLFYSPQSPVDKLHATPRSNPGLATAFLYQLDSQTEWIFINQGKSLRGLLQKLFLRHVFTMFS